MSAVDLRWILRRSGGRAVNLKTEDERMQSSRPGGSYRSVHAQREGEPELQWCFARKFLMASSPRLAGPNIIS
ncbi:hypothetical protein EYF80_045670 [Liparis tanakae]|uniref:Uncharacterized protein n=1 Tax=Liparis tanakae TaxID=230148 RepID=A0A4Z2FSI6_9TELE|nr:hypothetical protein EYF80_045670 [Liparis tanakae]